MASRPFASFDPAERYGLRISLLATSLILVAFPFAFLLEQVVSDGPLTRFDSSAAKWLRVQFGENSTTVDLMNAISFLGRPMTLVVIVGIPVLWLAYRRRYKLVTFLVVTCVGGSFVNTTLKLLVDRPRPHVGEPLTEAFGKSFPSGHSLNSVVCYGAVLLVFLPLVPAVARVSVKVLYVLLVLAIGTSRLTLGVHFVSDVVGGYVLGAAWLIASVATFQTWREEGHHGRIDPLPEGVEADEAVAL